MTGDRRDLTVRDPKTCHGQAVVKGTRIMVSVVLDSLIAGVTEEQILAEYPTLTTEGIRAAAAYRAELARDQYPAVAAPCGAEPLSWAVMSFRRRVSTPLLRRPTLVRGPRAPAATLSRDTTSESCPSSGWATFR